MLKIKFSVVLMLTFSQFLVFVSNAQKLSKDEVLKIAKEAYIYGLPAIFTDFTRQVAARPDNVFIYSHKFPDHTSRLVVRPNNDTNYSSAFLDLGDEPVVLTIPDTRDRYYVIPLMDAWTNVFASFGKRTTGTKPQQYVITGPRWKGVLPAGLKEVKSPTNLVWIIGRIQVNSPTDQVNFVSPIQDQFKLATLSKWVKGDTTLANVITHYQTPLPGIELVKQRKQTVVQAIKEISIEGYFNYLNELLVKNPGLPEDAEALKKFEAIGIKPGAKFSLDAFDTETANALKQLPPKIYAAFDEKSNGDGNKLQSSSVVGHYGTDYIKRAYVAYFGLGALPPEDASYTGYTVDANNENLDGAKANYTVHFEKGQTPPARAFWSLTLYDKDGYLSENSIRRYAIGDRNNLHYNKDGSLDIFIQHDNPGKQYEDNWLPAPLGAFNLSIRIYWPTEEYLKNNKSWNKPPINKILRK